jgi:cytidylate kinase
MKDQTREEPVILAAAERQMLAWALRAERGERRSELSAQSASRPIRFVAISREAGAGGGEIAAELGRRIGWQVFDKNLLDCVAGRFNIARDMLELVDETRSNWVYDVLGTWMDRELVPHDKYVNCLSRVIVSLARAGQVIFVGRGAQFLLPRPELLAVRIVASSQYRIRALGDRLGIDPSEARRLINELDRGRSEFAAKFFRRNIADPHLYDLVINVERSGLHGAVDEIAAALGPVGAPTPAQSRHGSPQSG